MSEFTSGPWEYVIEDDHASSSVTIVIRMGSHLDGANGWEPQHRIEYQVAARAESPAQFDEARANARLIVASPSLHEACRLAEESFRRQINAPLGTRIAARKQALDALRAALVKVEGR